MDMIQIGKFIAQLRKEHGFTQEQFGQKIGVTGKTVSRWETGTYLPPADALMAMSELFSVSVNEILSGRHLQPEEYWAAAEKNLTHTISSGNFTLQERINYYKKKWLKDHVSVLVLLGIGILAVYSAGLLLRNPWWISGSLVLMLLAHGWRHNTMMAYVERMAFDGTGA